jgi:hypothetical protein
MSYLAVTKTNQLNHPPLSIISLLLQDDSSSTSSSSNASLSPDGAEPTTEPEPEDDLVLQRLARAEAQAREEDEEFNREFAKMMSEQSDAKKGDRKANVPIFDTAVPLMRARRVERMRLEELEPPQLWRT